MNCMQCYVMLHVMLRVVVLISWLMEMEVTQRGNIFDLFIELRPWKHPILFHSNVLGIDTFFNGHLLRKKSFEVPYFG